MESKHTPGPWKREFANGGFQLRGEGMTVFTIDGGALPTPEDSRLIAATPEMLAALEWIADREWSSLCADDAAGEMRDAARAAIAKATGGES